jgi:hypothetical protein
MVHSRVVVIVERLKNPTPVVLSGQITMILIWIADAATGA